MARKTGAKTKRLPRKRQPTDFIASVGKLLLDLTRLGQIPTLVGGMALVTLGSTRVTKDFDFLIAEEARGQESFLQTFYKHGFELASEIDKFGNIIATIGNRAVALARLNIDKPKSAYFYNRALGLRIDLLFDFPIPASEVHEHSVRKTIQSYTFHIASKQDLIEMKEIALNHRKLSSDLQDLEFLKKL